MKTRVRLPGRLSLFGIRTPAEVMRTEVSWLADEIEAATNHDALPQFIGLQLTERPHQALLPVGRGYAAHLGSAVVRIAPLGWDSLDFTNSANAPEKRHQDAAGLAEKAELGEMRRRNAELIGDGDEGNQ